VLLHTLHTDCIGYCFCEKSSGSGCGSYPGRTYTLAKTQIVIKTSDYCYVVDPPKFDGSHANHQWCSQDRDLVKLWDRDFIKNSETRDLKFETETSKFVHLAEFFLKCHHSWVAFLSNLWHFPTYFGCFLPANTSNKKSLNYRSFTKPFLCNIQSSVTKSRDSITANHFISEMIG